MESLKKKSYSNNSETQCNLTKQENSKKSESDNVAWKTPSRVLAENIFVKNSGQPLHLSLAISHQNISSSPRLLWFHSQDEQDTQTDLFPPEHPGEQGQRVGSNGKFQLEIPGRKTTSFPFFLTWTSSEL